MGPDLESDRGPLMRRVTLNQPSHTDQEDQADISNGKAQL